MKKNIHIIFFLLLSVCGTQILFAQGQPQFDQFQFNQAMFNPAYVGSKGAMETNYFLHRQSVNILGAPSSESFTVHAPFFNDKVGLGLKIYHDQLGVTNNTVVGVDYAYRAHLTNKLVASFGLEASLENYDVKNNQLDAFNAGDPAFVAGADHYIQPNFSAGFYLQNEKMYIGLSSLSLISNSSDPVSAGDSVYDQSFEDANHIYLTGGAMLELGKNFALMPNMLLKMVANTPAELDVNANLIFYNSVMISGGYRTNQSFSVAAEYMFKAENTLSTHEAGIGYSFNYITGIDKTFLSPSHEIFLIYRFHKHTTSIQNPRFF